MVCPILLNLRETHLISKGKNEEEGKEDEDELIYLFKSTVSTCLDELYPTSGAAFETFQIASLLDPRFKARIQEQQPEMVQLLREKVRSFYYIDNLVEITDLLFHAPFTVALSLVVAIRTFIQIDSYHFNQALLSQHYVLW